MTPEEQWKEEFDKRFLPNRNTSLRDSRVHALGKEVKDFISSLLSSQKEALMRKVKDFRPNKFAVNSDEKGKEIQGDYNSGFNDCREQTLKALNEIE